MFRRDADQLSDTTVLLWDAVASGQPAPAPGEQAATFDLISNFLALDDAPLPDAAFLSRLEAQVIDAGTQTFALQDNPQTPLRTLRQFLPGSWRAVFPPGSPPRSRLSSYGHWLAAQAAMVILLLITAGGIGVVYLTGQPDQAVTTIPSTGGGDLGYAGGETGAVPAPTVEPSEANPPAAVGGGPGHTQTGGESATLPSTGGPGNAATPPATPRAESLLNTVVDPATIGAESQSEWRMAATVILTLSNGQTLALDEENWTEGLNAYVLLEGEIAVESGSPSQVIRAGSTEPEDLAAGATAQLSPGDSWLAGIGSSISLSNASAPDARLLMYHQGADQSIFGFGAGTIGVYPENFRPTSGGQAATAAPLPLSGPMSLTLERVTVSEGNAFNLDVADGETVLLFNEDNRSFDAQRAGSANTLRLLGGSAIFEYGPGSYTLKPMYRYPLTLYIARISSAPAMPTGP